MRPRLYSSLPQLSVCVLRSCCTGPAVRAYVLHHSRIGRYPPSDSLTYDEASVLAKETTDFPSKLCAQIEEVNK